MALIATDLTIQVILILIGFVLAYGGGFIQKIGAIGLFMVGLGLAATTQSYVSDSTTPISNVNLFFPRSMQIAMVTTFAILSLVTIAFAFLSLRKLIQLSTAEPDESEFAKKKRREAFFEELV